MSIDGKADGTDERLRRIEAITDAALSRLSVEDLLDELLDRVREVLEVDTAAVLLVDPQSQELVPTAARALDARQDIRLPIGAGFAGRVARDRVPMYLEHVDETNVLSPVLREHGIESLLGVPMIVAGGVIGVLHVGTLKTRAFAPDDLLMLQLAADRIGSATQARLANIDRTAALALQRSLLPTRLPEISGLDMAARYVPGHDAGVGGDWYDVFTLPSGWLGVVIGDVSGHGLRAAVVMGRLRSALRAYALDSADPADVLTRLDRKVDHFETGSMATVLYAMISPERDHVLMSSAGHLPPVLAGPHSRTTTISLPVDIPLGTGSHPDRHTTTVALASGTVIVLYTDGLIERRREPIDAGLRRLCAAVRTDSPEAVCVTVMGQLIARNAPTDDVALLVLRQSTTAAAPSQRASEPAG